MVGGAETGSWGREDTQQGGSSRNGPVRQQIVDQMVPHLHADNWEEQLGSKTNHATQGSSAGK